MAAACHAARAQAGAGVGPARVALAERLTSTAHARGGRLPPATQRALEQAACRCAEQTGPQAQLCAGAILVSTRSSRNALKVQTCVRRVEFSFRLHTAEAPACCWQVVASFLQPPVMSCRMLRSAVGLTTW